MYGCELDHNRRLSAVALMLSMLSIDAGKDSENPLTAREIKPVDP